MIWQPDPATLTLLAGALGTSIGSFLVAVKSGRKVETMETDVKSVKTSIEGPDDEPSLRQMVKDHSDNALSQFALLHKDNVLLSERVRQIEEAKGNSLLTTTVKAIHDHQIILGDELKRARLNIHKLAQTVQVTLFSSEEAASKQDPQDLSGK